MQWRHFALAQLPGLARDLLQTNLRFLFPILAASMTSLKKETAYAVMGWKRWQVVRIREGSSEVCCAECGLP